MPQCHRILFLSQWGQVVHVYINVLCHHWFRKWLQACSAAPATYKYGIKQVNSLTIILKIEMIKNVLKNDLVTCIPKHNSPYFLSIYHGAYCWLKWKYVSH